MKKVTHLCYSASQQTAAYRLHKSLISIGCKSQMITGAKSIREAGLCQPETPKERLSAITGVVREYLYRKILYINCESFFSSNCGPLFFQKYWLKKIYETQTEIIHLHWVGSGFIPIAALTRFNRPIVWTMHDMWPITGGCHVIGSCNKYETQCGTCPQIKSRFANDLTAMIFKKKKYIYNKLNLTIVVPSSWMEKEARKSPLLNNAKIYRIPNTIDTAVFKPLNKQFAREALNLERNKQIIAFGAISEINDRNKGFDLLLNALNIITNQRKDLLLLTFGGNNTSNKENELGCKTKYVGKLTDDLTLAMVYSAADLVVVPSRQESFSQVSAEAISCGTPVVAFDATGPRDIIDHKENGYLANPYDPCDLASGILWILEDNVRWKSLSEKARLKAINCFRYEVVGKLHNDLYDEILRKNGNR